MNSPSDPSDSPHDPAKTLICFCHGVTEAEIRRAIAEGARTIAEIQAKTLASTGCGGCAPEVERILAEVLAENKQDPQ